MTQTLRALVLFLLCAPLAISADEGVIYGTDNRQEINNFLNQEIKAFQNAVALRVDTENILPLGDGLFKLKQHSLDEGYRNSNRPLCEDVRFREQAVSGGCTGFLISQELLVTAGHCAIEEEDCKNKSWIFGVNLEKANQNLFSENEIYFCKEIISQRYLNSRFDFAIIQLDREVEATAPLLFSRNESLAQGDPLFMIGHPLGLPMKIVDEGNILQIGPGGITTSLDAFGGNSGSPIFSHKTNSVSGILIRGEADFNYNPARGCFEEVRCTDYVTCGGEYMTAIDILKLDEIERLLTLRPELKSFQEYCQNKHPTTEILKNHYTQYDCVELESNLKKLKRLSLNGLNISDIAPLGSLTDLEYLSLKDNQIKDIYLLQKLDKLKKLNLNGNPIGKNDIQCPSSPHIPLELHYFCTNYVDGE